MRQLLPVFVAVALMLCGCGTTELDPPGQPLPAPATPAAPPAPPPYEQPTAPGQAQEVLALLRAERFEELAGHFSPTMAAALPAERLETTWRTLVEQLGGLPVEVGRPGTERVEAHVVSTLEVGFPRARLQMRVSYDRDGRIDGLFFVPQAAAPTPLPAYADPSAFVEREVRIGNDWPLPATLTLPRGSGPFPAVVLVHGSGPQDRDQSVGSLRPFRDLAAGLASRGVAVLRYEKRTRAHGAQMARLEGLTVREEVVEDAVEAVRVLAGLPEIDRRRVVVAGHSLGGMLIPRIAAGAPEAAAFVAIAAPGRPLTGALEDQLRYLLSLDPPVAEREALERLLVQTAALRTATSATPAAELPFGLSAGYWLDLRDYHPALEAARLQRPLLVIHAGRDYQVGAAELHAWRSALAGSATARVMEFPALNHLLVHGEGASTPAEYERPGYVDAAVVEALAEWVGALPPREGVR